MRPVTPDDYKVIGRVLHRYYPNIMDPLRTELVSAGHLGLARAAERYDPDHASGIDFHNFSWGYVLRAMQDALRTVDHLTRTDRQLLRDGHSVRRDGSIIVDQAPATLNVPEWANTHADPVDEFESLVDVEAVQWAVEQLEARDKLVVRCVDLAGWSIKDVAMALGVTESRISQLRSRAHRRMRVLLDESMRIEDAA